MYIYLTTGTGLKVYNKIHYPVLHNFKLKNKLVGNRQWIITLDLSISYKPRHLPKKYVLWKVMVAISCFL